MKKTHCFRPLNLALVVFALCTLALRAAVFRFGNNGAADEAPLHMAGGITPHYASEVGGVAFMNTAVPTKTLSGLPIIVRYQEAAPDGHRFKAIIGVQEAAIRAPDWLVIPAIRFADSDYTAAYTILRQKRIHPALRNNQMGVIAAYVDNMLLKPMLLRHEVRMSGDTEDVPFIPAMNQSASLMAALEIKNVWDSYNWSSYIYTDENVQEIFTIQDGRLEISGHPYVYVWSGIGSRDFSTGETHIRNFENVEPATTFFRTHPQVLIDLNPAVFATAEEFSHLVSFFRYLKNSNPDEWSRLTRATASARLPNPASADAKASDAIGTGSAFSGVDRNWRTPLARPRLQSEQARILQELRVRLGLPSTYDFNDGPLARLRASGLPDPAPASAEASNILGNGSTSPDLDAIWRQRFTRPRPQSEEARSLRIARDLLGLTNTYDLDGALPSRRISLEPTP